MATGYGQISQNNEQTIQMNMYMSHQCINFVRTGHGYISQIKINQTIQVNRYMLQQFIPSGYTEQGYIGQNKLIKLYRLIFPGYSKLLTLSIQNMAILAKMS